MATIIGAGGHADDIYATTERVTWRRCRTHSEFDGRGGLNALSAFPVIIGINNPLTRAHVNAEIGAGEREWSWIHPSTFIGPRCEWGTGTHINYGVTMTRTTMGDHCTISPGATICGDVTIGDRVLVGAGSTICDRVTIGDDVTVGAGTVILPGTVIPAGETWVGVPARKVRP